MNLLVSMAMVVLIGAVAPAFGGDKATLRFLAERAPDDFGDVVLVTTGNEGESFSLPVEKLSESFTVPTRVISLLSKRDERKLAGITLPANGDSFVVLLIPEPKGTLKSLVVDVSGHSFRSGDVFLCNSTELPVAGHLGTTDFVVEPGEGKPLRPGINPEDISYNVVIHSREEAGDRVIRTLRWPVQMRSRSYCFVFRNQAGNRIEIRAVDEFVKPEKN